MRVSGIVIGIFLFISLAQAQDKLRFAPLPMQDKQVLYDNFYPMLSYLENKLHKKIEFVFLKDYQEILANFKEGKIDLAYLGPLPYVELKKEYAFAKPLVAFKESNGYATYTCSLVTSLTTTQEETVALTQPLSTCGYLSVNALINKHLNQFKFKYLGRHDLVALSILNGEFDMGGLKTAIYQKYYHLGLQEISRTKPLPTFALIANTKTLPSNILFILKNALVTVSQEQYSTWGEPIRYGVQEIEDSAYNPVREMLQNTQIPMKGNMQ